MPIRTFLTRCWTFDEWKTKASSYQITIHRFSKQCTKRSALSTHLQDGVLFFKYQPSCGLGPATVGEDLWSLDWRSEATKLQMEYTMAGPFSQCTGPWYRTSTATATIFHSPVPLLYIFIYVYLHTHISLSIRAKRSSLLCFNPLSVNAFGQLSNAKLIRSLVFWGLSALLLFF